MISRRRLIASAAPFVLAARYGFAQDRFPDHDIIFIVPWNAGGSNDILARGLQPLLREQGANIVIENQPGATGAIGLRRVAAAAPDGYTLGMGTSSTVSYMMQGKTQLRNSQFTPIARCSIDPRSISRCGSRALSCPGKPVPSMASARWPAASISRSRRRRPARTIRARSSVPWICPSPWPPPWPRSWPGWAAGPNGFP